MSNPVHLYATRYSQPSRAVEILLLRLGVAYEFHPIDLMNGTHRTPEYKALSPVGKVPLLDDGGFVLAESHTIMRYTVQRFGGADHWYPADLKARSRVDQYLDWHHSNIRANEAGFFFANCVIPLLTKQPPAPDAGAKELAQLAAALDIMGAWLSKSKFIASDEISIADISAICELGQLYEVESRFASLPKNERVTEWYQAVKAALQPEFDVVFADLKNRFGAPSN